MTDLKSESGVKIHPILFSLLSFNFLITGNVKTKEK